LCGLIIKFSICNTEIYFDITQSTGVKILRSGNIVKFHPVDIVDSTENGVWISGLPETTVLITVGQEYVRDGQEVIPVDEETLEPMAKGTTS